MLARAARRAVARAKAALSRARRIRQTIITPARGLLVNGLLFSVCFAGLEGCVAATIALAAAVVPQDLASRANSVLYLTFALFTFPAPAIVERYGCKNSMVISMMLYSLYLLAFVTPRSMLQPVLFLAAAIGGGAGAVLWTAQGEYFTMNSLAYAAARGESGRVGDSRAIGLFAGVFAVTFQVCIMIGKPLAGLLLTLEPDRPELPALAFSFIAALCTFGMSATRSLEPARVLAASAVGADAVAVQTAATSAATASVEIERLRVALRPSIAAYLRGELSGAELEARKLNERGCDAAGGAKDASEGLVCAKASDGRVVASDAERATAATTETIAACGQVEGARAASQTTAARPQDPAMTTADRARVGTSTGESGLTGCSSLTRRLPLLPLLLERRLLLLTPTNAAFGMATALFPSKMTPLVKHRMGAAAAGWMYTAAGLSAAIFAVVFAAIARLWPAVRGGRALSIVVGALCFAAASAALLACEADGLVDACPELGGQGVLLGLFVLYGIGIASWQGSCMALVGDLWKYAPRAAFAHLKLTSGLVSFHAFLLFPHVSIRFAATYTLAVVLLGLLCFSRLVVRLQAESSATASLLPGAAGSDVGHAGESEGGVRTGRR